MISDWMGAIAFPEYNIVLTTVDQDDMVWASETLPHEITHLLVGELVFGPYGDVPVWLHEGLAEYSTGPVSQSDSQVLDWALLKGYLVSLSGLSRYFPSDSSAAYLAYLKSHSVAEYLIEGYGWEKMRALLILFKEGTTIDKALLSVYGFDMNGLDEKWLIYIENQPV